ncbi:hypothetical protein UlMin_000192 [Ulmus minor]
MANMTRIKTSSDGAWQGENPLNYAFPLLILQTILVLLISRLLAFLLKPLRQPKVIAEILGGILLGPSALGRNKHLSRVVFPSWSTPLLESVASIGLIFFLFLVGLELDLSSIRRSGRRAFTIALAGISVPFLLGIGVTFLIRGAIKGEGKVGYAQCLLFMGVSLSITAFPVLARILAELKLLTTQVGEIAMAAAAFNDVAAWILLALAVALAGAGNHSSPLVSIWVLVSGFAFVLLMLILVRPVMNWVGNKCSNRQEYFADEAYICLTLAGVMASGFMTDLIGIHSIFGAFVFGLTIPKGGDFAGKLIKRIEDFVCGLLLPLYFASSGLKTDVTKISGGEAWALLLVVISISCAGKILGTFVVAMLFMIPVRESLALGVLMNTKGLVELIVLNIGKEKKVLDDETFAILVLMALFSTFLTTPTVTAIYRPSSDISRTSDHQQRQATNTPKPNHHNRHHNNSVRILACVHGPSSVPSLINLIDSIRATHKSPLKLYVMHLVELTDRSSSILMVQQTRKNGVPFVNRFRKREGALQDQVATAFEAYGRVSHVTIRHFTAISALSTMHEDILHVAEAKRVSMILMPFYKQYWRREDEEGMEILGNGWREINQRVVQNAPCLVAVFVDRGFGTPTSEQPADTTLTIPRRVCVVFLGGSDDREALKLGGRMAQTAALSITVVRLIQKPSGIESINDQRYCCSISALNDKMEMELDEAEIAEQKSANGSRVEWIEKVVDGNIVAAVAEIGQSGVYELVIVGKGRFLSTMTSQLMTNTEQQIEEADLGAIGDILSQQGIHSSVLVIQHHQVAANGNESTAVELSKIIRNDQFVV